MRMKLARRVGRIWKATPTGLQLRVARSVRAPRPPRGIAKNHDVAEDEFGRVRSVWLDKSRSQAGVLVFLHGGGYTSGPVAPEWQWMAAVCEQTGCADVLIDYRLGDVCAYPAAVDDAQAAIVALADRGAIAPGKWALAGSSAGGGHGHGPPGHRRYRRARRCAES